MGMEVPIANLFALARAPPFSSPGGERSSWVLRLKSIPNSAGVRSLGRPVAAWRELYFCPNPIEVGETTVKAYERARQNRTAEHQVSTLPNGNALDGPLHSVNHLKKDPCDGFGNRRFVVHQGLPDSWPALLNRVPDGSSAALTVTENACSAWNSSRGMEISELLSVEFASSSLVHPHLL